MSSVREPPVLLVDVRNLAVRAAFACLARGVERPAAVLAWLFAAVDRAAEGVEDAAVLFALDGGSWRRRETGVVRAPPDETTLAAFDLADRAAERLLSFARAMDVPAVRVDGAEADDVAAAAADLVAGPPLAVSDDADWTQVLEHAGARVYQPRRHIWFDAWAARFGRERRHAAVEVDGRGRPVPATEDDAVTPPRWWRLALCLRCLRGRADLGLPPALPRVRAARVRRAWQRAAQDPFALVRLLADEAPLGGDALAAWHRNRRYLDWSAAPTEVRDACAMAVRAAAARRPWRAPYVALDALLEGMWADDGAGRARLHRLARHLARPLRLRANVPSSEVPL